MRVWNHKTSYLFLLGLLGFSWVEAQEDSSYIQTYPEDFSVKGSLFFNLMNLDDEQSGYTFVSNNPAGLALAFSYQKLFFDLSYGYSLGVKADERYERTHAFDFQIHSYQERFVVDAYFQKYHGFHIDDETLPVEKATYPEMNVFLLGLVGQYIWNHEQFSYQAAYQYNEKQLRSVGSWLIGLGIYYFQIDSDSFFVYEKQKNVQSLQVGFNGGYAFNWVFATNWLLNSSFSLGVNVGHRNAGSSWKEKFYVTPAVLPKISLSYHQAKWSCAMVFVANVVTLDASEDHESSLSTGRFEFSYIRRFHWLNKKNKK